MKAWWQARQPRERLVLGAGSAIGMLVLAWALVWDPLLASRDALRLEVARQSAQLAWMRPAVADALSRGNPPEAAPDGRSLLARADAGARAAGLGNQLVAVEPQGNDRVSVRLVGVDFDRFAAWLESLATAGLSIDELSVQRAAANTVDVRLALSEASP